MQINQRIFHALPFCPTSILPSNSESPLISHDLIPGQHVNDLLFLTCRHVVSGQMLSFSSEIERWPSPVNTCHCEGIIPLGGSAALSCGGGGGGASCLGLISSLHRITQHRTDIILMRLSRSGLQPITTVEVGGWDCQMLRICQQFYSLTVSQSKRFLLCLFLMVYMFERKIIKNGWFIQVA